MYVVPQIRILYWIHAVIAPGGLLGLLDLKLTSKRFAQLLFKGGKSSMASKISVAVIGMRKGMDHARAYAVSNQADLRWVVDMNEPLAARAADELGCAYATNWKEVLDEVDAISIVTPHHLHAPMALEALAAGKHVLIEKPMATTEEDCFRMITAAEEQKRTLMVAHNIRFRPSVQRLKQAIETEEFGKVININCWVEGGMKPNPGSWFSRKDSLGGGVLIAHGCHYIDAFLWLLGQPERVTGLGTRIGTEWMEGEGTQHSTLLFTNGALAHLTTSWGMKFKNPPARMHVHTTEACLILNDTKLEVITEKGKETLFEQAEPLAGGYKILSVIDHFLDCIRTGHPPLTDGYSSLAALQVIWSIYEQNGVPITWGEVKE